ncbi:MAG: hypothetical protein P1P90_02015 [Patescibacteria group bacterium]|nr:hypothetical protein [Patescibacteria group bacterium]
MTQIGQLSTFQELQTVVIILQIVHDGKEMMQMLALDPDGSLQKIRWTTSGDDELYSCSLHVVTDAVIPMMRIITGQKFERTKTNGNTTTFERVDFLEAQKPKIHN